MTRRRDVCCSECPSKPSPTYPTALVRGSFSGIFFTQFSDFHFFGRIIKSVHSVVVLGDVGDGVELLLVLEVLLSCVFFF